MNIIPEVAPSSARKLLFHLQPLCNLSDSSDCRLFVWFVAYRQKQLNVKQCQHEMLTNNRLAPRLN